MSDHDFHYRTWAEFDNPEVELVEFVGGKAAIYSRRCPTRGVSPNEDSACLIEVGGDRGLIAVADGVGGGVAGNRASRSAINNLVEHCRDFSERHRDFSVREKYQLRAMRGEILDAVEATNQEIINWGIGSGTTLTIAEISGCRYRWFHIGDSGMLVTSNRGTIKFATVGHAPIAQAVAIGMLDAEEALVHDDRNLVSNCVGSADLKVEVGVFQRLSPRDTLLLASDGLFDNLTKPEIVDIIRKGDLKGQTARLVALARERMSKQGPGIGKPDDLTVICYRPPSNSQASSDT